MNSIWNRGIPREGDINACTRRYPQSKNVLVHSTSSDESYILPLCYWCALRLEILCVPDYVERAGIPHTEGAMANGRESDWTSCHVESVGIAPLMFVVSLLGVIFLVHVTTGW